MTQPTREELLAAIVEWHEALARNYGILDCPPVRVAMERLHAIARAEIARRALDTARAAGVAR